MRGAPAALCVYALLTAAAAAQTEFKPLWNRCAMTRHDPDQGIAACQRLRQAQGLEPVEYAFVEVNIGFGYQTKGDTADALAAYAKAIAIEPNLWPAYIDRIDLRLDGGEIDAALDDYAKLMVTDPSKLALRFYGLTYASVGETGGHGEAHETNEHALAIARIQARLAGAVAKRSLAEAAQHDFRKAIADLDKAVSVKPDYAAAFYLRGLLKQRSGDIKGADADRQAALALDPSAETRAAEAGLEIKTVQR